MVNPAEVWEESGRYQKVDDTLVRFTDRSGRAMVLAMTHEESATDLVRTMVHSFRQLPLLLYQIQTKFRDEPRPRAGLIRLREFLMQDGYSFHEDTASLDETYEQVFSAYRRIFSRVGIDAVPVESDSGFMGGQVAHEFMLLSASGEDTLVLCPACGYAANREVARFRRRVGPAEPASPQPVEEVSTPGATSIEALTTCFGWPRETVLKTVFLADRTGQPILAVCRGDLSISEVKLGRLVGSAVQVLSSEQAEREGLVPGYAGPGAGLPPHVRVVADVSVDAQGMWVTGANRVGYHGTGMRLNRDFTVALVGDIATADEGDGCPSCGKPLSFVRGIEVGNIFKLGTYYAETMGLSLASADGREGFPTMGCYGIGITRLLASVIEQHHDQDGIRWPDSVAPWSCHLIATSPDPDVRAAAESLYEAVGPERCLYDDRQQSPGIKFKDRDLLGMPWRLTVSPRTLAAGGVGVSRRTGGDELIRPLSEVAALVGAGPPA